MAVEYTHTFWEMAFALANGPKQCAECKKWHQTRFRPWVIVRVVLMGDGEPIPARLRLLCKKCFPESRLTKLKPRLRNKDKSTPLFDGLEPLELVRGEVLDVSEKVRTARGSR